MWMTPFIPFLLPSVSKYLKTFSTSSRLRKSPWNNWTLACSPISPEAISSTRLIDSGCELAELSITATL